MLRNFVKAVKLGYDFSRLVTTEKGYIGLAHNQSRNGDSICLLQGCTRPTILWSCEGGYSIVGESYVHGIMDGEFWSPHDESSMQDLSPEVMSPSDSNIFNHDVLEIF